MPKAVLSPTEREICIDTVKFYFYFTLYSHNKTGYITQVGTGSCNEKTNAMYTDLSFMTADHAIGEDTAAFFRNMLVNKLAEASRAGVKGQLIIEKPGAAAAAAAAFPKNAACRISLLCPAQKTGEGSQNCLRRLLFMWAANAYRAILNTALMLPSQSAVRMLLLCASSTINTAKRSGSSTPAQLGVPLYSA